MGVFTINAAKLFWKCLKIKILLKIIQKWQIGKIENEFIKISFYKGNNFYWIVKYVHLINIA